MRKHVLVTAFAALVSIAPALADGYPTKPITFIVPFAAGGPLDSLARAIAEPMSADLGQPIVIENVAGAGGSIGVGRAAHAAPDGYTVSVGNWSTHVLNGAIYHAAVRSAQRSCARRPASQRPAAHRRQKRGAGGEFP